MTTVPPTTSLAMVDSDSDEPETCDELTTDGDICGRDRPCRYHD